MREEQCTVSMLSHVTDRSSGIGFFSLFHPYIVLNKILKKSNYTMTKTMLLIYKRSHSSAELVHDPEYGLRLTTHEISIRLLVLP